MTIEIMSSSLAKCLALLKSSIKYGKFTTPYSIVFSITYKYLVNTFDSTSESNPTQGERHHFYFL